MSEERPGSRPRRESRLPGRYENNGDPVKSQSTSRSPEPSGSPVVVAGTPSSHLSSPLSDPEPSPRQVGKAQLHSPSPPPSTDTPDPLPAPTIKKRPSSTAAPKSEGRRKAPKINTSASEDDGPSAAPPVKQVKSTSSKKAQEDIPKKVAKGYAYEIVPLQEPQERSPILEAPAEEGVSTRRTRKSAVARPPIIDDAGQSDSSDDFVPEEKEERRTKSKGDLTASSESTKKEKAKRKGKDKVDVEEQPVRAANMPEVKEVKEEVRDKGWEAAAPPAKKDPIASIKREHPGKSTPGPSTPDLPRKRAKLAEAGSAIGSPNSSASAAIGPGAKPPGARKPPPPKPKAANFMASLGLTGTPKPKEKPKEIEKPRPVAPPQLTKEQLDEKLRIQRQHEKAELVRQKAESFDLLEQTGAMNAFEEEVRADVREKTQLDYATYDPSITTTLPRFGTFGSVFSLWPRPRPVPHQNGDASRDITLPEA